MCMNLKEVSQSAFEGCQVVKVVSTTKFEVPNAVFVDVDAMRFQEVLVDEFEERLKFR